MIAFVSETASVPAPVIAADLNSATVSFKRSALPDLIVMLRNEDPVSVTINNQAPGFVFVHTGVISSPPGQLTRMRRAHMVWPSTVASRQIKEDQWAEVSVQEVDSG